MKALLVDSAEREIREVEYEQERGKGAPTLQEHIGGYIETAYSWPNGDVLFVDEEGLFKPQLYFFRLSLRTDQPFAGNGIVVGKENFDENGDYIGTDAPTITADELRGLIEFKTRDQVDAWAKANASDAAAAVTFVENGVPKTEVIARVGSVWGDMPRPTLPVCDRTMRGTVIGEARTEAEAIATIRRHFRAAYPEQAAMVEHLTARAAIMTCLLKDGSTVEAWIGKEA